MATQKPQEWVVQLITRYENDEFQYLISNNFHMLTYQIRGPVAVSDWAPDPPQQDQCPAEQGVSHTDQQIQVQPRNIRPHQDSPEDQ